MLAYVTLPMMTTVQQRLYDRVLLDLDSVVIRKVQQRGHLGYAVLVAVTR